MKELSKTLRELSEILSTNDDKISDWVAINSYNREEWDAWDRELVDPRQGPTNFIPSPLELIVRREMQKYMAQHGFPTDLIRSVMMEDQPEFWLVVKLHKKYGVEEAYERLRPFIIHRKYDDE